jgi:Ser/Thr protein kinase RdoA (MazF antagonist)
LTRAHDGSAALVEGGRLSPSPLELLHPDGPTRRVSVHGSGAPAGLAPSNALEDGDADVAVVAPDHAERRDRAWVREAARAASLLARDGLVVAPRPSRRLRAELIALGLVPQIRLLHVPDFERSRYLVPLRGKAAEYALRRVIPLPPLKRIAARALRLPGIDKLGPTSVVFRRPGSRPALEWLCALRPPRASCTAIVTRSWRPDGATVVQRFGQGDVPDAIAKVGGGAGREAEALRSVGQTAPDGVVAVPTLLEQRVLGGLPVAVVTPVAGLPAPRSLRGSPDRARSLLRAIAGWLGEWNGATAARRRLEPPDAERQLLAPARRLAPLLADADAYLERLMCLCDRCQGAALPFVAAHNDLTASNVLLADGDRLGVVDWEEAASGCLPLGDLAYAAVDFAAAVDGYRDRPAAFAACFEPSGPFAELTQQLLRDAAASLGIDADALELSLHACWLRHADNERREASTRDLPERPFLGVLRRAAAWHSP